MTIPGEVLDPAGFGSCPVPKSRYERVLLGHGSGGCLSAELIQGVFLPAFANDVLERLEDQATLECGMRISDCGMEDAIAGSHSALRLSPPIRSWSGRCSFPAATSASARSTAR